jgi:radical SAM superfamily enzyme YgiQ (UPF0313 family)
VEGHILTYEALFELYIEINHQIEFGLGGSKQDKKQLRKNKKVFIDLFKDALFIIKDEEGIKTINFADLKNKTKKLEYLLYFQGLTNIKKEEVKTVLINQFNKIKNKLIVLTKKTNKKK